MSPLNGCVSGTSTCNCNRFPNTVGGGGARISLQQQVQMEIIQFLVQLHLAGGGGSDGSQFWSPRHGQNGGSGGGGGMSPIQQARCWK